MSVNKLYFSYSNLHDIYCYFFLLTPTVSDPEGQASIVSCTYFDFVVIFIVFNDWFGLLGGEIKIADTGEAASRHSEPKIFIRDMSP